MKLLFVATITLLLNGSTYAQEQTASLTVNTVDGHPRISISNRGTLAIEAFLVSVAQASTNTPFTRIYYDVHAGYRHDTVIPPDTSKEVPLPFIEGRSLPNPTLQAVVFSDGTTVGDPYWVNELLRRRVVLCERLREVMSLLQNVSDKNMSRDEAVKTVKDAHQARQAISKDVTRPEERIWNDQIFHIAARSLAGELRVNGQIPPAQTAAKSLINFYGAWLSDLQAAKPHLAE
jgi:hypothetical protein